MRLAVIALVFGTAVVAWLYLASLDKADRAGALAEKFTAADAEREKRNSFSSDIMDIYKAQYGKYPQTEVLVHYRDAAVSGGLSLEEVKSRIKADGGAPPGVAVPSEAAERAIAEAAAAAKPKADAATAAPPGAKPVVLGPDVADKLTMIAMQVSALAEQVKAAAAAGPGNKAPQAFESFIAF